VKQYFGNIFVTNWVEAMDNTQYTHLTRRWAGVRKNCNRYVLQL